MRWVAALVVFVVLSGTAYSQSPTVATQEEDVVRRVITSGGYDGFADKALSRMGDPVAVQVTKVVAGRELTEQEIDGVLLAIHLAFSDSKLVIEPSDRTPRATLFVLHSYCAT